MSRPETGSMKFGDDWRGVFIRGDNAGHFAMVLDYAIALMRDGDINKHVLKGLRDTLAGSDERVPGETQHMRDFDECSAANHPQRAQVARFVDAWSTWALNSYVCTDPATRACLRTLRKAYALGEVDGSESWEVNKEYEAMIFAREALDEE